MALIGRHYRLTAPLWGIERAARSAVAPAVASGYGRSVVSTVAIGVDASQTAAKAIEMGVEIARRFDANVVLLSAIRTSMTAAAGVATAGLATGGLAADPVELDWAYDKGARIRHVLESTESRLRRSGLECRSMIDDGDAGDVLVRLAEECGADLLVVGSKGMQRRMLGSVPNTVTHKAPCSVLVVKTT